jgi:lathosterol oxidase
MSKINNESLRGRLSTAHSWGAVAASLSVGLGAMSVGAVLCFWFPAELTTPELRAIYPIPVIRALLHTIIAVAFALGLVGVFFGRRKMLPLAGSAMALLATALGGGAVSASESGPSSPHLGLDWFLLDLFLLAFIYVPLERLFPRVRQPIFREGFGTDLAHFFVNHVLVHVLLLVAVFPAATFLRWARSESLARSVSTQPLVLQVAEIIVVADVFQYAIHRLCHEVPLLWRVHALHHSSTHLDWLAGSRLHLVDIVVVRAVTFAPLFVVGFSESAVRAYAVFVAIAGVFLHANLRFRFGALEKIVTTPRYHAFHHAADAQAFDKNFAFHLPILDRVLGTQYLPAYAWPRAYGLDGSGGRVRSAAGQSLTAGRAPLHPEETTAAIEQRAKEILDTHGDAAIGTEVPFAIEGRAYVARIDEHYHEPGGPRKPWGHHRGVTVYHDD